jgi:5-carboxymethyl-2-hydroxymuconate isomerase
MPHIILDYSANIEARADIAGLCEALRVTAAGLDCFPETGVRVRAIRADHVALADGSAEVGYVDISVRLREGRAQHVREAATAALFQAARDFLADLLAEHPVMLSLEMREIDAKLAPKINTVANRLERKPRI